MNESIYLKNCFHIFVLVPIFGLQLSNLSACEVGWTSVGNDSVGAPTIVEALTGVADESGFTLYVGGLGGVRTWDGEQWDSLGSESGWVRAMAIFDSGAGPELYAGGMFTAIAGVESGHIAKWNGNNWEPLAEGTNGIVQTLHVHDDGSGPALYVGGHFTLVGQVPANHIARWDGQGWSAVGDGMNGHVYSLTTHDFKTGPSPQLIAGGRFTIAGQSQAMSVAQWNGESWSSLGFSVRAMSGEAGSVWSLASDTHLPNGELLYIGGSFTTVDDSIVNYVLGWDGSSLNQLENGTNNYPMALEASVVGSESEPRLFMGGSFLSAGTRRVQGLAQWTGLEWAPMGDGVSDANTQARVHAIAAFSDEHGKPASVYVGGIFQHAGGCQQET